MTPDIWFPNLGISFEHVNNVAFNLFGIDIMWYGMTMGLGVLAGALYAVLESKRTGQDYELYIDFLMYAIITGIVGARIYYVAFAWDEYKDNLLAVFAFRKGGLAIYGTLIATVLTAIVFTKIKKINFWLFTDTASPGLILGQILGRYGNFFNKEAFGGYTDGLFAMRIKAEQVSFINPSLYDTIMDINGVRYLQVHPTFLYESCWNIALFIFIQFYKGKKKFDGEIFAIYLIGYACGRVWIEGMRTDQLQIGSTGIAISQVLSIVLIVFGVLLVMYKRGLFGRKKAV